MGRKRNYGRPLDGVVVVDKTVGMTSNDVVQQAKRLFYASKAGHTGALDPLATGVLPICFGNSTKFSQYLLDADKTYESTFCLGVNTDTADAEGRVVDEFDAAHLTRADVEGAIDKYRGDIAQIPPMYSALKKDGQPLYKLARQGIEVEREARQITIYRFELLGFIPGVRALARVLVECSKGTYIRSLAEDIGRDLGVGGHVEGLRRTRAGTYDIGQAVSLADLQSERLEQDAEVLDHHLLPVDSPLQGLGSLCLEESSAFYFKRGQAVMDNEVYRIGDEGDTVRVFDACGQFLGVGQITDDGRIAPKRLIADPSTH
ncbi:MAG: tRNA pseudouridine55 synthase [Lentisphaeria bacterium]